MSTEGNTDNPRLPLPQTPPATASSHPAPQAAPAAPTIGEDDDDFSAKIEGSREHRLFPQIVHAIQQVYDPEIPVNICELGLIYRIEIDADNNVIVTMTLTSPACPSAQELPLQVRGGVSVIPDVKDVEVNVTFDPPWGPDKMSDVARVTLGMM